MDRETIWESIKQPLRQGLLFIYAVLISKFFDFVSSVLGFNFTDEQKVQIMGFGTPVVWSILSFIDNLMHRIGKEKESASKKPVESQLTTGLTRF